MFNSIRLRLLALLSSIFLMLTCAALYDAYERRQADTRAVHEKLQAQAKIIAEQQGDSVRRAERFLDFIVSAISVSSLADDPDCAAKMRTYVANDPYLANVFITDPSGKVICNPRPGTKISALGDRDYFKRALVTPGTVAGDPVFGRFSGRWVLPYAKRQLDPTGRVSAVVVASLDLDWVNRSFSSVAAKSPGLRLGLVTSKGLVLARQPDAEHWVGKNIAGLPAFAQLRALNGRGSTETKSHDGETRIYAFAPFAKTVDDVIYLWITVPRQEATAMADRQLQLQVAIITSLIGLSFGLAWYGGYRFLVRPIEALSRAARRVAQGEHGVKTELSHGDGEFGRLAMAMDDMIVQLDRYDAVTGLLNLPTFEASVDAMLAQASGEERQRQRVLIRLQLDAFDQLESTFGLAAAVDCIKLFAQLLAPVIGTKGIVCRIGEGNFAIAMLESFDGNETSKLVEEIERALVRQPLVVDDLPIEWGVAYGASLFPHDGLRCADLLRHAGTALAQVQRGSPTRLRFYERAMNERLMGRMRRLADLKTAIEEGPLEQYYQPQLDLHTGRLIGFEALIRWKHPDAGYISPVDFIGLAEGTGLIVPLGDWVMRQAMEQLVSWRTSHPELEPLAMAINISGIQFSAPDFATKLREMLAATGAPPGRVELEVTESQLMHYSDDVQVLMRQLKTLGVQLSIDDFGTGYSSLAYLKHFSVDRLKIDKCFVDHLAPGTDDAAIVEATIAMGHRLGLEIIAEGIESKQQFDLLRLMGCDQVQGYYVSRPLTAQDAEAFALRSFAQSFA